MSKDCDNDWFIPAITGIFLGAAITATTPLFPKYFHGLVHYDKENGQLCLQEEAADTVADDAYCISIPE